MAAAVVRDGKVVEVHAFLMVIIVLASGIVSAGASWATMGYRVNAVETRVGTIEADLKDSRREWQVWRNTVDIRLATISEQNLELSKSLVHLQDSLDRRTGR